MIGNFNTLDVQVPQEIVHYWGWFLAFGVALLLIGAVAIVRSVTATIVSMLFFGWLLALASEQSWLGTGQVSSTTWWRQYSLE